jgi:pimeloyl-ACP methyl ester carboxylesterase
MEYRGYGRSGGTPGQKTIVEDAVAFRELLGDRPEVDVERIAYHGRSIGGGVACALAAQRPPSAMILESTFSSLASMAKRYLLPSPLCRHPFRNDQVLAAFDGPVLLMHGTNDFIIPHHHSEKLHGLCADSTLLLLPGGHNDFPSDPRAYVEAIQGLLGQVQMLPE